MTITEELRKVYEEVGTMSMYASAEARLDAALLAVARYSAQRQQAVETANDDIYPRINGPLWMDE